jgi:hypothetical protein
MSRAFQMAETSTYSGNYAMILTRRNALRSLFLAAPAIVAAPSLMRVSAASPQPNEAFIGLRQVTLGTITWYSDAGCYYSFDARTGRPLNTVADYRARDNA